jgi:RNA polymerase sigma-70 factor (ECF subfamily)
MMAIIGMDWDRSFNTRSLPMASDLLLTEAVRRAQQGDEEGFHALVVELGPLVYRFLVVRLAHEGDAKDALQETLIAAWQGLPALKRPESVRSWILTIAVRKATEVYKARPPLARDELPEANAPDAVQLFEIRDALGRLPPNMRDALLVRYLLGLSEQETAQALHVPLGTVKSRTSRARRQMAALLEREPQPHEQKGGHDAPWH